MNQAWIFKHYEYNKNDSKNNDNNERLNNRNNNHNNHNKDEETHLCSLAELVKKNSSSYSVELVQKMLISYFCD